MTAAARSDPAPARVGSALRFATVVTVVFGLLLVVALARHEMWRDELQAWMLARDSGSLAALYANTRYEGHTALWFLLSYALSRVTRSPVAIQALNAVAALATVFVVTWRAPFRRRWRVMLVFGYFFAYGYAVVSRPYALGVLLLMTWCAVRTARPASLTRQGVLLALLANTSAYGVLLAGAGVAAMSVPLVRDAGRRTPAARRGVGRAALVVAVGMATAFWWMVPPPQHVARVVREERDRADPPLVRAALVPVRSLLPVPAVDRFPRLWETNALLGGDARRRAVLGALGVALLLGSGLVARRSAEGAVFFATAACACLCFEAMVYPGWLYHHGHLFVAFVAMLWLARDVVGPERLFVDALLVAQLAGTGLMLAADLIAPFAAGAPVAAFLTRRGRADGVIVAADAAPGSAVAGYLDRPLVYAERGEIGTFVRWNLAKRYRPEQAEGAAVDVAARLARDAGGRPVTLLLSRPAVAPHAGVSLTLLAAFADDVITNEPIYVYDVRARR